VVDVLRGTVVVVGAPDVAAPALAVVVFPDTPQPINNRPLAMTTAPTEDRERVKRPMNASALLVGNVSAIW
jgi:hypothetical protein